nr:RloB domain-containing protein [Candidatus Acetatifactor stercoripullorum]
MNATEESEYKVSIDCRIQKNPLKHAKSLAITQKVEVYHFFDYESDEEIHVKGFQDALANMKEAQNIGKQITYKSGYSNFTFDLWIVLHMMDCNTSYSHRRQYVTPINQALDERFENMDEFKKEANFKRCLGKLQLSNVIDAVERAKKITCINIKDTAIIKKILLLWLGKQLKKYWQTAN